jgi:hypothetical protein
MSFPLIEALAGIWLATGIAAIAILWNRSRQPLNDHDRHCSRVDEELDDRDRAARWMGGGWRA